MSDIFMEVFFTYTIIGQDSAIIRIPANVKDKKAEALKIFQQKGTTIETDILIPDALLIEPTEIQAWSLTQNSNNNSNNNNQKGKDDYEIIN